MKDDFVHSDGEDFGEGESVVMAEGAGDTVKQANVSTTHLGGASGLQVAMGKRRGPFSTEEDTAAAMSKRARGNTAASSSGLPWLNSAASSHKPPINESPWMTPDPFEDAIMQPPPAAPPLSSPPRSPAGPFEGDVFERDLAQAIAESKTMYESTGRMQQAFQQDLAKAMQDALILLLCGGWLLVVGCYFLAAGCLVLLLRLFNSRWYIRTYVRTHARTYVRTYIILHTHARTHARTQTCKGEFAFHTTRRWRSPPTSFGAGFVGIFPW